MPFPQQKKKKLTYIQTYKYTFCGSFAYFAFKFGIKQEKKNKKQLGKQKTAAASNDNKKEKFYDKQKQDKVVEVYAFFRKILKRKIEKKKTLKTKENCKRNADIIKNKEKLRVFFFTKKIKTLETLFSAKVRNTNLKNGSWVSFNFFYLHFEYKFNPT